MRVRLGEESEWKIRYNNELYQLYQHPSVVRKLRTRRLQWAGHVQRMEENVSLQNPNGYRKKGRPRTRCSDIISRDARAIGVPNWRTTAKNREVWKAAID